MATFNGMFGIDKNKEREGVWHSIGAGVRIKVARSGTPEYNATVRELAAPFKAIARRLVDSDEALSPADERKFKEIDAQAMAKHVLVDWEGFTETNDEGSPVVPYSEEKAVEFLLSSDEFRDLVAGLARKAGNFRAETSKN